MVSAATAKGRTIHARRPEQRDRLTVRPSDRPPIACPPSGSSTLVDETHDPTRISWVESAQGHPDFPIQNLPFGVFHRRDDTDDPTPARVGMAIGDFVLDLTACHDEGWFTGAAELAGAALAQPTLNALLRLGAETWTALRRQASALLAS